MKSVYVIVESDVFLEHHVGNQVVIWILEPIECVVEHEWVHG